VSFELVSLFFVPHSSQGAYEIVLQSVNQLCDGLIPAFNLVVTDFLMFILGGIDRRLDGQQQDIYYHVLQFQRLVDNESY
jgi:hypothetical protein